MNVLIPASFQSSLLRRLAPFLAMGAGLLGGCGYQASNNYEQPTTAGYQWHSLYREDIQTVAVPTFTNKDYTRGVEFRLSKAVINKLEALTPYKVVSRDKADTILQGEIMTVAFAPLSNDYNTNLPQEQLLTLTVNFTWKDLRNGQILVNEKNVQQSATFYPTLGEGEFVGQQEAIEKLAVAIVQRLESPW